LPKGLTAGVRWDPLELAARPAAPVYLSAAPPADPGSASEVKRSTSIKPGADAAPVVPEVIGDVVITEAVKVQRGRLVVRLTPPPSAGLYRLTVTLADHNGDALSGGKQSLLQPQLVRVSASVSVAYRVDRDISVPADAEVALPVTVTNTGSVGWEGDSAIQGGMRDPGWDGPVGTARLTAQWVSLGGSEPSVEGATALLGLLKPGESASVSMRLKTPPAPGTYGLFLDVVTPRRGSLVAAGSDGAMIRVTVR
jgi:hypothetical protein